jgi:hypothetical protein
MKVLEALIEAASKASELTLISHVVDQFHIPPSSLFGVVSMTMAAICVALFLFVCAYAGRIPKWRCFGTRQDALKHDGETDLNETSSWWNDLTSPLTYNFDDDDDTSCLQSDDQSSDMQSADVVHFCFLVHGHRGFCKDLSYLQKQMRRTALQVRQNVTNQDMVVHSAVCNEKKTTDGVKLGGERLALEILQFMREHLDARQRELNNKPRHVTISILGNSLGGLYARHAIAELVRSCEATNDDNTLLLRLDEHTFLLHFNVFCTTATPHLGVADITFIPIPRTAEIGVAHAMGQSGKDLFRLNDLLKTMATTKEYLEPLGMFTKRVAYANAYGTDFPVVRR